MFDEPISDSPDVGPESFILSYRSAKSSSEQKQITFDYLDKHFKSKSIPAAKDFPEGKVLSSYVLNYLILKSVRKLFN